MAFRFSGHETFPCRYAWLPKAFNALRRHPGFFADEEAAMVELGLGKNMVRATRFWVQAMGVANQDDKGRLQLTSLGKAVFGPRGHDPFLEDPRTLWLLHWNLCGHVDSPLFAWDYMLNRWSHPEFTRTAAVNGFREAARSEERELSDVTLGQHFDVFLHSYVPTRSKRTELQEDTLDCPLVELELITRIGERRADGTGRREPIYSFRREPKPGVSPALFSYCLASFWAARHRAEKTLPYREIVFGHGGPGQIFKLPEDDVRARLAGIENDSAGRFSVKDSAFSQHVIRHELEPPPVDAVYAEENCVAARSHH